MDDGTHPRLVLVWLADHVLDDVHPVFQLLPDGAGLGEGALVERELFFFLRERLGAQGVFRSQGVQALLPVLVFVAGFLPHFVEGRLFLAQIRYLKRVLALFVQLDFPLFELHAFLHRLRVVLLKALDFGVKLVNFLAQRVDVGFVTLQHARLLDLVSLRFQNRPFDFPDRGVQRFHFLDENADLDFE